MILDTAWAELDEARRTISNLQQQNTKLLEDIAALRLQRNELLWRWLKDCLDHKEALRALRALRVQCTEQTLNRGQ